MWADQPEPLTLLPKVADIPNLARGRFGQPRARDYHRENYEAKGQAQHSPHLANSSLRQIANRVTGGVASDVAAARCRGRKGRDLNREFLSRPRALATGDHIPPAC